MLSIEMRPKRTYSVVHYVSNERWSNTDHHVNSGLPLLFFVFLASRYEKNRKKLADNGRIS